MTRKCGFVALVGAPNAGKSTLLNRLVGAKVSIVSPKIQTTRMRVTGVAMSGDCQIILVDTPGIFDPKRKLEKAMVKAAWQSVSETDLIAVIVDAGCRDSAQTEHILQRLNEKDVKPLLILNKIDTINKNQLLEMTQQLTSKFQVEDVFMISALEGDGVQDLEKFFAKSLPEGDWHFPEDQLSNLPQKLLAAEITREKVFHLLHQELPYAIAVETIKWEECEDGSAKIYQDIHVLRDSQKAMVVGKGGTKIKMIGEQSRIDMQELFGRKMHLFLHVRVNSKWLDQPRFYTEIGLEME
ncbi:MAG: GTPase Era [Alphaproteobacteria bacterium]